jgi:hypothetical protein
MSNSKSSTARDAARSYIRRGWKPIPVGYKSRRPTQSRWQHRGVTEVLLDTIFPHGKLIAICPFHDNVTIRVGDDAAESHAYVRATKVIKSDGTTWEHEALHKEINRQLDEAADGVCPECAARQHWSAV